MSQPKLILDLSKGQKCLYAQQNGSEEEFYFGPNSNEKFSQKRSAKIGKTTNLIRIGIGMKNLKFSETTKFLVSNFSLNLFLFFNNFCFVLDDFEQASAIEKEELDNPTEHSDVSSESSSDDADDEAEIKKDLVKNVQDIINKASDSNVPKILKRPGDIVPIASKSISEIQGQIITQTEEVPASRFAATLQETSSTINERQTLQFTVINDNGIASQSIEVVNENQNWNGDETAQDYIKEPQPDDSLQKALHDLFTSEDNVSSNDANVEITGQFDEDIFNGQVHSENIDNIGQKLDNISKILNFVAVKQIQMDKKIDSLVNALITTTSINVEEIADNKIPADSIENLDMLEEKLNDLEFRASMVSQLSFLHLGGLNYRC